MAPPASKRRKTDHISSEDDDDDDASFASFGEDGSDEAENSGVVDDELDSEDHIELDGEEEREDGRIGHDNEQTIDIAGARKSVKAKTAASTTQQKERTRSDRTVQIGASAHANGTFKSNIFKLQVDELLTQIRPKHGRRETEAESALHTLKKSIEQIPARGPYSLTVAERDLIKEKVAIPFPDPPPPRDAKYKFAFAKPANINVAGSFALKTSSRTRDVLQVDMVVCMPADIFQDKDYLNYRYFYKRAFYLASIAAGLQAAHKSDYTWRFNLLHDDPLKPILVVGPAENITSVEKLPLPKWSINIIPCVAGDQFAAHKLKPDHNCVRSQATEGDEDNVSGRDCTPTYNSSLRADMLVTPYLNLLHHASKGCDAFVDACHLGSTWLRQRGFASSLSAGGFGHFELDTLMALCLQGGGAGNKPLLSNGYSSYQLFKATLQLIATKDFSKQPLVIGKSSDMTKSVDGISLVWDVERSHNILYRLQSWACRLLRYEARLTVNALGDQIHDAFDATFILRAQETLYRFDQVVIIPLPPRKIQNRLSDVHDYVQKVCDILNQGLGDRVRQINLSLPPAQSWRLGSSPSHRTGDINIGIMINPDTAKRTVDHGPPAENKNEAAAFRKFWGERAELRRFKDGSILESLIWTSPAEAGQSVMEQIVRYVLARHAGLVRSEDVRVVGDVCSTLVRGGAERTVFESLLTRYHQFENDLRELRDLPLTIRQIMPADASLRCASLDPPLSSKVLQRPRPAADVTIQFEGSGRWPDELAAIQRTKLAFLLKINDMLQGSTDSVSARVGLENGGQEVLNQGYLDVSYDSQATFRLRIYHDREQTLHERRLKDKSVDPRSREISAIGLAKYKRDYIRAPAHTQAITRLTTRFPALSGSIRLTKRWFASHLLTNHIADEVIELLVARTFTHTWPWQAPSSVQTGFFRTLFWISRWDWRAEPLVVDLSGELKPFDMQAINTNFEAWRKLDPAMNRVALFIASNLDHDGNTWTDGQPAKVVAGRMTALAKAACVEISEKQLQLEPLSLFSSPLEDFDFVLHVNAGFTRGRLNKASKTGATAFKNLELETINDPHMIGFDAVQDFANEIEHLYGSAIMFFHGGSERPVIAGLWSPLTARRSWKVNLAYSTVPRKGKDEEDDVQADPNKSAVLAEIARIGGDLIEKVEVFSK